MRPSIRFIAPLAGLALFACAGGESTEAPAAGIAEQAAETVATEERQFDPSQSDPEAIEIARAVYDEIGGDAGFDRAAQIAFRFVVERDGEVISDYSHVWDRAGGRYRLEGAQTDGMKFLSLFNVNGFDPEQPTGDVWVGGRILDDFEKAPHLIQHYGRFINDTYWLLMPAKLLDPGVILKYDGEASDDTGAVYDVLHVSFEKGIGLTDRDQYWAYVNRETHCMDKWEYILEGDPADAERTVAEWHEWEPHGPLLLSTRRDFPGKGFKLLMADLEVSETVDETAFQPPTETP